MQVFEMIVLIVLITTVGGIMMRKMGYDDDGKKMAPSEEDLEREARIKKLEERVAVLEKIATDKRMHLVDEIDNL